MLYFVIIVLSCALSITCLYQKTIYTNTEKVENRDSKEQENEMHESIFMIEGTITNITFADLSKTNRVQRHAITLHLKTTDLSYQILKFTRYPALESDKQLRVGQHVSITARKVINEFGEYSEYLEIIHIEPL